MNYVAFFLCLTTPLLATEPKVHRDLAYAEPKSEWHTLDVYAPSEGHDHPIIVWIHGGAWRMGDGTVRLETRLAKWQPATAGDDNRLRKDSALWRGGHGA
jgi:hypothetical protein